MEPATVIGSSSELYELIQELEQAQYIAIDTESNSFHAYYERICLIQISTTERDYIIDPLALKSIQPLKDLLANPRIEKIFHAASNDVSGLRRDFRFDINNLFDTAQACKMLGYKQLGLAAILEQYFGVQLNKKWQRHNWSKRPLTDEQINYARLDTHYLIPLRRLLADELNAGELWEQAQEVFHKACSQESQERMFQPDGFLRISGARSLDALGKNILQTLYIYRDQEARRRDRAPFRIFSNEALVRLAGHRPSSIKEFARVKGLPRFYRRGRAAYEILETIRKIMENSIETDPAESVITDSAQAACKREKSPRR